jgi:hypothetical protein
MDEPDLCRKQTQENVDPKAVLGFFLRKKKGGGQMTQASVFRTGN